MPTDFLCFVVCYLFSFPTNQPTNPFQQTQPLRPEIPKFAMPSKQAMRSYFSLTSTGSFDNPREHPSSSPSSTIPQTLTMPNRLVVPTEFPDNASLKAALSALEAEISARILKLREIVDRPTELDVLDPSVPYDLYELLESTRVSEYATKVEQQRAERLQHQARLLVDFVERVKEWVKASETSVGVRRKVKGGLAQARVPKHLGQGMRGGGDNGAGAVEVNGVGARFGEKEEGPQRHEHKEEMADAEGDQVMQDNEDSDML